MNNTGQFTFDVTSRGAVERSGQFAYDALTPSGRRKSAPARITREDVEVRGGKRDKLKSNARDIAKNFSIAGWMVRRHLDYVSSFRFHPSSGDRGLDTDLADLMEVQSRPLNCDRGGRCNREKMFRLIELARVLDGDIGMLRLRDGRTQLIESDLIKDPSKQQRAKEKDAYEWVDGVQVDYAGFQRQYSIHGRKKGGSSTEYQRTVPVQNFHLYGFFDRSASDQVRGISPIVAALNPLRDVYEGIDYSLVKFKISQLFALALLRKPEQPGLDDELPAEDELNETTGEPDATQPGAREFDLTGGPTVLDLDPDESIEVVESATPGTEFATFTDITIAVALKSLDLPYSFYNERFTNYSGSRTAWLHYERACADRRADQIEARRRWTLWHLQQWIADGLLTLPSGMSVGSLRFKWVPRGMPWWKPSEEIVGDLKSCAGGLNNIYDVCHQRDTDFETNVQRNLEAIKYVRDRAIEILGEEAGSDFRLNWEAAFAGSAPEADGKPEV